MAFTPDRAGPRSTRSLYHWCWQQLKKLGDQVPAPSDPPPSPPPPVEPGEHNHWLVNLIDVDAAALLGDTGYGLFYNIDTGFWEPQQRVNWVSPYIPGEEVNTMTMVFDSGWTMVSNKPTTDRAAPQPVGEPTWNYPTDPTWLTQSNSSVVYTGHLYTFN